METKQDIRRRIHEFIDLADDRILHILNAIIITEQEIQPSVPEAFYRELDKERERHIKGESLSYSWEEVKSKLIKTHGL